MRRPKDWPDGHERAGAAFRSRFGASPHVMIRSPGRIQLVGEQADHQDGYVLSLAIERALWLAVRPRTDDQVILHSVDLHDTLTFNAQAPEALAPAWPEHVKGVTWALKQSGHPVPGWEGCVASDLPMGVGLASSAAFSLAVARAYAAVAQMAWEPRVAAHLCRQAEQQWLGAVGGALDHLAVACAEEGAALLLDARNDALNPVAMPDGFSVVLLDAGVNRTDLEPLWRDRMEQSQAAASRLGTGSLRDLDLPKFVLNALEVDDLTRRRARHIVTENQRVTQAVRALERGDGDGLGIILNMSHASLRDDFQLTDPTLNRLAQVARGIKGCAGARMLLGRQGGLVVALVSQWALGDFLREIEAVARRSEISIQHHWPTRACSGVSLA